MPKRSLSATALLFASVSAILGSGWLFSAFYTAKLAGPSALFAWMIGGLLVIVVAFVFAELTAMIPIVGSSTRMPLYTHGSVVSFVFSWMIWLSYAALVAAEVQAVVQYLSYFEANLTYATGGLTAQGYLVAGLLMTGISALNIFSLRWLIRSNNFLTLLKIVIPLILACVILFLFFSPTHLLHPAHSPIMPFGFHGIFAAIASGGIVFAFNGFKQACEMAGEAKNPKRTLPLAIVGSIVACLCIYLLLQAAFLSSLNALNLSQGWKHLLLPSSTSPLASIMAQDYLSHWMFLLYIGAIIGPIAAGLMYANSAGRSLFGVSKNGYLPAILQKINPQGNPVYAISANLVVGMMMFAPLPGWNNMITFLTSLIAITYAIAPICLMALRAQLPQLKRPFKLPFAKLWSFLAFYICTLLSYWTGWKMVSKLGIAVCIALVILFFYNLSAKKRTGKSLDWHHAHWMWPYFAGLMLVSYLGNYGGGRHILASSLDFSALAILCLFTLFLSYRLRLPSKTTQAYIDDLDFS